MPIVLVTGPANAGKAHMVLDALRAHVGHGESPLLVVPTETDQARYRRELAEGGVALGARVERFEGLLGEVLVRAGLAEPQINALARECMLARLAGARPGMASALARFVAAVETRRVTPAQLREALDSWVAAGAQASSGQATLGRLCSVYEAYHEALAETGRADRELRFTKALDALRRAPALWGATPVLLYGFDDLTELQLDTIETLGRVVGARVTVSLAYEPGRVAFAGRAGAFQRLAPLADSHTQLPARAEHYTPGSREALHHLERSLLTDDPQRIPPGEAVRLLEGGSPRAELELVAGEIRALLDRGVRATEIAIVHRAPEAIAELIGEVLDDFDIPHVSHVPVRFAHTAIGRGALGLLRCATGDGQLGDLLAWLRVPGVLDNVELADRLEADARRQGVVDSAHARALWEAEHWPLERTDRLCEAGQRGTVALAEALAVELGRLFCAPRRAAAAVLSEDELNEARALAGARRALEELCDLGRFAPALVPTPAELVGVLERLELSPGGEQVPMANGVAILAPLSLRARRVRMLFACGMQEGVFPAPAVSYQLLGEDDRRSLAQTSGLVLQDEPDVLAVERYLLYALASRPEERLTLSWHTADEQGRPLARSLFVDDVCELFSKSLEQRTVRRYAGAADWPGPGLPAGAMAARGASPADRLVSEQPSSIAPLRDELVLGELHERVLWSASSLESWVGCPVKWFVEQVLRGGDIDPDPEPMARGGLAHAALKDTLQGLRERSGSGRLTPASLGLARRLLGEALDAHADRFPLSVVPERQLGARRRLQADLERYLEHAATEDSPLEPTHLELEFGLGQDDESSLPALPIGEEVLLRGRIDRVDVGPGGEAVVYDYKNRSAPPGAKWVSDSSFQMALYMRAVERLLGHVPVGGFYQPLTGKDIRARGALDVDSGVELDCVRTDRREHADFEELIGQCVQMALDAVGQARSGALEPRPDTCAYGKGCAYPTICRCER